MELILRLKSLMKGKKTYIICFLLFLISCVNLLWGDVTIGQFFQDPNVSNFIDLINDKNFLVALGALGGASHRAALAKY